MVKLRVDEVEVCGGGTLLGCVIVSEAPATRSKLFIVRPNLTSRSGKILGQLERFRIHVDGIERSYARGARECVIEYATAMVKISPRKGDLLVDEVGRRAGGFVQWMVTESADSKPSGSPRPGDRVRVLPGAYDMAIRHPEICNFGNDIVRRIEGKTGRLIVYHPTCPDAAIIYLDEDTGTSAGYSFDMNTACRTIGVPYNSYRLGHAPKDYVMSIIPDASTLYKGRHHRK